MKACVVIPARGQPNISRAIGSVFAQRHEDWVCVVIGKAEIKNFLGADKRVIHLEHDGTICEKHEVGLRYAMEHADFWTTLKPEDWFQTYKLVFDNLAMQTEGAVFGPFITMQNREVKSGEFVAMGNSPLSNSMRRFVLRGVPAISWANVAIRTDILKSLPALLDPRVREYPYVLLNMRVAQQTRWVWRGEVGGTLYVAPEAKDFPAIWAGRMTVDVTALEDPWEMEPLYQRDYLESCRVFLG